MLDQIVPKLIATSENGKIELILRVMVGFIMTYHGFGKVLNPAGLVPFLEANAVPFPLLGAYLAAYTEFLGGLALMFGLATRLASLGLLVCMSVAIYTLGGIAAGLHSLHGGLEYQWTLFSVFLYFTLAGAGKCSLDAVLESKCIVNGRLAFR
ncbi:membrane protein distant similarity to thiosulphate:quinone oxidoreductase DoxD [Vibrio maritimus]|uniref:Membrane protein distant similarity to thiosulphate:quinone oxidoreductase DoxD n=1 Tax=Vibrio maritimus TaxID=990268 RepID=A0A090SXD6_9VIBR|nr:membrane protein distant similarity to thiosulphate:quinone oxidoreductase DoxD [Vibrio maritimus]